MSGFVEAGAMLCAIALRPVGFCNTTTAGDTSLNRFGDYVTVRRSWPSTNMFSAAGYSTRIANQANNCPSNGTFAAGFGSSQNFCFDPHYASFRHGP